MTDRSRDHRPRIGFGARAAGPVVAAAAATISIAVAVDAGPGAAGPSAANPGPVPWEARAESGMLEGFTVRSDAGETVTRQIVELVIRARAGALAVTSSGGLPARALPTDTILIFGRESDARRVLASQYSVQWTGPRVTAFTAGREQFLAVIAGSAPTADDSVLVHAGLAAVAGDLLETAASRALTRPFGSDVPPALAAGLGRLARDAVVTSEDAVFAGLRRDSLVAAQIVLRDSSARIDELLALDAAAWKDVSASEREAATVLIASYLQFAGTGGGAADAAIERLAALGRRLNAGDRPDAAVARTATGSGPARADRGWRTWLRQVHPDPLAEAVAVAEALADGLAALAAAPTEPGEDVAPAVAPPASVEEARARLAADGYVWTAERGGESVTIDPSEAQAFILAEDPASGRRPVAELTPTRPSASAARRRDREAGSLPPAVDVKAVRGRTVSVTWSRDDAGQPVATLVISRR